MIIDDVNVNVEGAIDNREITFTFTSYHKYYLKLLSTKESNTLLDHKIAMTSCEDDTEIGCR